MAEILDFPDIKKRLNRDYGKNKPLKILTPAEIKIPKRMRRIIDYWSWRINSNWFHSLNVALSLFHILLCKTKVQPGDKLEIYNSRTKEVLIVLF